eukprot:3433463-Rhodomonas_salina.3
MCWPAGRPSLQQALGMARARRVQLTARPGYASAGLVTGSHWHGRVTVARGTGNRSTQTRNRPGWGDSAPVASVCAIGSSAPSSSSWGWPGGAVRGESQTPLLGASAS